MNLPDEIKDLPHKQIGDAFYFPFMDREDAEDYVKEQAEELVKEAEEEQWLENASDEELIDKDWWQFFFYRCNYNCDPIWANDKDWEKQSKRKVSVLY